MKALEFYAAFPNVSCQTCREGFEEDRRNPPCDEGRCPYTKDGEEPPKFEGYGAFAWGLWNEKELLGWNAVEWKLSKMRDEERYIVQELLKSIEMKAIELEIKQPKIGGMF